MSTEAVASGWSKRMAAMPIALCDVARLQSVFRTDYRERALHPLANRCGTNSREPGGVTGLAMLVRIASGMPHVSGVWVGLPESVLLPAAAGVGL